MVVVFIQSHSRCYCNGNVLYGYKEQRSALKLVLHLCAVAILLVGTVYSNCICVALIDSVLMVVMFLHAGR